MNLTDGSERITILLADGHSLFRDAVRVVFAGGTELDVVAEARDGVQAVAEAERTRPDVALLDADLPNCDGIRATELIRERLPECQVIVLSGEQDEQILIRALEAGATGYLTKEYPLADLMNAVQAVHRGETLVPPRMLGPLLMSLLHRRRRQDDALRLVSRLTRREREVLALLADGADNNLIAQTLVISPQTARTHIQNVLGKIGVHSRLEAAAFVLQNGIKEELNTSEWPSAASLTSRMVVVDGAR